MTACALKTSLHTEQCEPSVRPSDVQVAETAGSVAISERYELCRSVHGEANAIIAASREQMLGADLYMACVDPKDGSIVGGTCSCMMCKRMVINAGIARVIIRDTKDDFRIIEVNEWIDNDDSMSGQFGY